jgi:Flp pilus assembly pilin Flp
MKAIWVKKFCQNDFGANSVEYAILLCCIAVLIVSAVGIFGNSVKGLFVKDMPDFHK